MPRFLCWYGVWDEKTRSNRKITAKCESVATNGSGGRFDQLAEGEVWVLNPLHRANRKAHGSSVGFSVGTVLWGETSVQTASKKEKFHSVAPKGRGVQLDQPAEGGVWVRIPWLPSPQRSGV